VLLQTIGKSVTRRTSGVRNVETHQVDIIILLVVGAPTSWEIHP
jgi:hypothetical protein